MVADFRGLTPMIQIFDMPASIRFYCDVLGFTVVTASGPVPNCGWALLRRKADEIMLNTQFEDDNRPPAPDVARQRLTRTPVSILVATIWMRRTRTCRRTASRHKSRQPRRTACGSCTSRIRTASISVSSLP